VAVHLGIGLALGMMEFGLAMITANLAFLPLPHPTTRPRTPFPRNPS